MLLLPNAVLVHWLLMVHELRIGVRELDRPNQVLPHGVTTGLAFGRSLAERC